MGSSLLCLLLSYPAHYGLADEKDDGWRLILEARGALRAGYFPEALGKLGESFSLAEKTGQKLLAAIALGNIAEAYRLQGNGAEALVYYEKALSFYRDLRNQNGIAITEQKMEEIAPRSTTPESGPSLREKLIRDAIDRVRDRVRSLEKKGE